MSNRLNLAKNPKHVVAGQSSGTPGFKRRRQYAASKPMIDDHVDIIHANMTQKEVQYTLSVP